MRHFIYYIISCSFLISSPAFSLILIDEAMSPEEQKKSGISKLTISEQRNLEKWLSDNFVKKSEAKKNLFGSELYVSEVINGGQQIRLSDNTLYEITPEDWVKTQGWITLTRVEVTHTKEEYYPFTITNPNSGYSIRGRLISSDFPPVDELLKEESFLEKSVEEYAKPKS